MNLMSAAVYGRRMLSARARAIAALSVVTLRSSGADAGKGAVCVVELPDDAHADVESATAATSSFVRFRLAIMSCDLAEPALADPMES